MRDTARKPLIGLVLEPLFVLFAAELHKKAGHRVGMHAQQAGGAAFVALRGAQGLTHGDAAQLAQVHERQRGVGESSARMAAPAVAARNRARTLAR